MAAAGAAPVTANAESQATPPIAYEEVAPVAPAASNTERPAATGAMGTQKLLGLVTGGVGLAGVPALGGVFGLLTISEKSNQQNDCPNSTSCTSDGHVRAPSQTTRTA